MKSLIFRLETVQRASSLVSCTSLFDISSVPSSVICSYDQYFGKDLDIIDAFQMSNIDGSSNLLDPELENGTGCLSFYGAPEAHSVLLPAQWRQMSTPETSM